MITANEFYFKTSVVKRYTLAIIIFLASLGLRLYLLPIEAGFEFIFFFPATVIGFYLCGVGPGTLIVVLSAVSAYYFFIPPYFSLTHAPSGNFGVALYLIGAYLIRWIVGQLQGYAQQTKFQELESTRHYREAPVMSYSADAEGRLLKVSNLWCKTLGYQREDVIGRSIVEFFAEAQSVKNNPDFFPNGCCSDIPLQMQKQNGDIIDPLLSVTSD